MEATTTSMPDLPADSDSQCRGIDPDSSLPRAAASQQTGIDLRSLTSLEANLTLHADSQLCGSVPSRLESCPSRYTDSWCVEADVHSSMLDPDRSRDTDSQCTRAGLRPGKTRCGTRHNV